MPTPPGRTAARRSSQPLEERILLTATLCLLAAGAVMVYSASSARSLLSNGGDGTSFLIRYLIYGGVGLLLMRLLARRPLEFARRLTPALLGASFVLVLATKVPGVGIQVNGARRWLGAGFVQFEPSELMKLALVLYAATLLSRRSTRGFNAHGIVRRLLIVVGAGVLLVAAQPDLGTALVMALALTAVLVAAGMPMRQLAMIAGAAVVLVGLFAVVQPYARARLTSFLHPWAHAGSSGFQAVQGQIAIGSGGLLGVGPGRSVQKIFYLPEAHTDFILAVIGEELGVLGISALLFLYGLIAYAGLRAARAARSSYARLLAVGLTSLILCQALLNVFAVLGLAPLTGVPLPFVSYGASNLVIVLGAMGLLLNVAAGGGSQIRALDTSAAKRRRWEDGRHSQADSDRRGRNRGTRRARIGGGRRAAS
ncbi:MAG TPA: putative lipid II flippase FtsW [Solirubrobacteraceae bacterium]|jgi:cell division protein FtsW|nr:putative lipid II flippase FtsW [Solirubrobacteraceae bacterium]